MFSPDIKSGDCISILKLNLRGVSMKQLTEEMKKDYLSHGGTFCPFCDSNDLNAQGMNFDAGCAWQKVICESCGETWTDIYDLVSIEQD